MIFQKLSLQVTLSNLSNLYSSVDLYCPSAMPSTLPEKQVNMFHVLTDLQKIKTMTFDPYNISDVGDDGFYCSEGQDTGGSFAPAFILPSKSKSFSRVELTDNND